MPDPLTPPPAPGYEGQSKLIAQFESDPPLGYTGSGSLQTTLPLIGSLLSNISGIDYNTAKLQNWPSNWHAAPPYKEQNDLGQGTEIVITYIGPWSEGFYFQAYMLGWSTNVNGVLKREIPFQCPIRPWLYAVRTEIVETPGAWAEDKITTQDETGQTIPIPGTIGFFDTSSGSDALSCKIAVTFRRLRYEVRADNEMNQYVQGQGIQPLSELARFVERQVTLAVNAVPIPQNLLYYQGTSNPIPQSASRLVVPTGELTYIWHNVPDIPWGPIGASIGSINSLAFDAPTQIGGVPVGGITLFDSNNQPVLGLPPGTVQFGLMPKIERVDCPNGRVLWDIIFKFLVMIKQLPGGGWVTWNHFPSAPAVDGADVTWVLGTTSKTGAAGAGLYPKTDLNQLFTQPNPATLYQGGGNGLNVPPG